MAHTCYGEHCMITGSWDCPNRYDREEADKCLPEEIEKARKPVRDYLERMNAEIYREITSQCSDL